MPQAGLDQLELPVGAREHRNVGKRAHGARLLARLRFEHIHAARDAADFLGNENGLGKVVRRLHEPHPRPVRPVGVQRARPARIVRNHGQGGREHRGRGAVVFGQVDGAQAGQTGGKPVKAPAARPAEAVNRLVRVADHKQTALRAPRAHQVVLHIVDVLKFVHQQVAELPAARGVLFERLGQQVVEVEHAARLQTGAVILIQRLFYARRRARSAVFDARDRLHERPGAALCARLTQHVPRDGERLALGEQAHIPEQMQADRVEGADRQPAHRAPAAQLLCKARAQFGRGLVGEGHRGDLVRFDPAHRDQVRDARDQGLGLARTGPRDDRDRVFLRLDRCLLGGVERVSRRGRRFRAGCRRGLGQIARRFPRGGRRRRGKQRHLAAYLLDLRGREQGDCAVSPVVARAALHLARAQAADALGHARAGRGLDVRDWGVAQDGELIPQLGEHVLIALHGLFRRGRRAGGCGDRLGQGREAFKGLCMFRAEARGPVGKLLHPVFHADGQLFPAYRAQAAARGGLRRGQAHAAVPVSVQVVFALLGEKLDRAAKARPSAQRAHERGVIAFALDQVSLAPEFGRRVRVRVRDQRQPVERGHAPVHRRIGGQAGFDRMDVRGQVVKAFLHAVKARECAEHGKVRRPDVRGDELRVRTGVQRQLEQVTAVHAEDGAAVRMDIAHRLEPRGQFVRRLQAGQQNQVVHLACFAMALVD